MNFIYYFSVLLSMCLVLSGCSTAATSYHLKAMPYVSQSITYENNYQIVRSEQQKTTVSVFPMNDLLLNNDVNSFYVIVDNKGYGNINFSPDDIKVKCGNGSIKVFTFDESVSLFNKKNELDLRGVSPAMLNTILAASLKMAPQMKKQEQPNFLKRQSIPQGQEQRGIMQIFCENCEGNIAFDVTTVDENHSFNFSLF